MPFVRVGVLLQRGLKQCVDKGSLSKTRLSGHHQGKGGTALGDDLEPLVGQVGDTYGFGHFRCTERVLVVDLVVNIGCAHGYGMGMWNEKSEICAGNGSPIFLHFSSKQNFLIGMSMLNYWRLTRATLRVH